MPGSLNLFDGVDLTSSTEWASRFGAAIDTLQVHHTTTTSYDGARDLMDPGGRVVSSNGLMSNTGYLAEVVLLLMRAFTSGSVYDRRCLTVEVCNLTLGPEWLISDASRERLAQLAVAMFRAGILGSLTRAHIIGHNEVPGSYATACPGPNMLLDWIVARAQQIYAGGSGSGKDKHMRIVSAPWLPGQNTLPGAPVVGDYVSGASGAAGNPAVSGGRYLLVNEISGRSVQIRGTQSQIDSLGRFINDVPTFTEPQSVVDWVMSQLAKVAVPVGGGSGGTPDLTAVLNAIAAGEAQDAKDVQAVMAAIAAGEAQDVTGVTAILTAIGGVDEATLATFGFKRI